MPQPPLSELLANGLSAGELVLTDGTVQTTALTSSSLVHAITGALNLPIVVEDRDDAGSRLPADVANSEDLQKLASQMLQFWVDADARIRPKGEQLANVLGSPVGETQFGPHGGAYRSYEHGAVYWQPAVGELAMEVHGPIHAKYLALGGPSGLLGYPQTDEQEARDRVGRLNHFEGGSIYWHPATGAWEVHGAIRHTWLLEGAEIGHLGYPISDEQPYEDPSNGNRGRISRFRGGEVIYWFDDDVAVAAPKTRTVESGPITSEFVHGWATLMINSAGEFVYKGHLHNAGFLLTRATIEMAPLLRSADGTVGIFKIEQELGGTMPGGGPRDYEWEQVGQHDFIRDQWEALRFAQFKTTLTSNDAPGVDMLIVDIIVGVLSVIFISDAADPHRKTCIARVGGAGAVGPPSPDDHSNDGVELTTVPEGQPCPPGFAEM